MNNIQEELLSAYIRLSTSINNPRVVSKLTYNESLICNILYKHRQNNTNYKITATDLCNITKMLKSQMNRTLRSLEAKDLITRERSSSDKRLIYISMNLSQASTYEEQHSKILEIVDIAIKSLGEEDTKKSIELFNKISDIADNLNLS